MTHVLLDDTPTQIRNDWIVLSSFPYQPVTSHRLLTRTVGPEAAAGPVTPVGSASWYSIGRGELVFTYAKPEDNKGVSFAQTTAVHARPGNNTIPDETVKGLPFGFSCINELPDTVRTRFLGVNLQQYTPHHAETKKLMVASKAVISGPLNCRITLRFFDILEARRVPSADPTGRGVVIRRLQHEIVPLRNQSHDPVNYGKLLGDAIQRVNEENRKLVSGSDLGSQDYSQGLRELHEVELAAIASDSQDLFKFRLGKFREQARAQAAQQAQNAGGAAAAAAVAAAGVTYDYHALLKAHAIDAYDLLRCHLPRNRGSAPEKFATELAALAGYALALNREGVKQDMRGYIEAEVLRVQFEYLGAFTSLVIKNSAAMLVGVALSEGQPQKGHNIRYYTPGATISLYD